VIRGLALALAALAVAVLAGTAQGGDGLVRRQSHVAPFSVLVPASWRYHNATYPSDHSSEDWTDPANRRRRLHVEMSACVGCVELPSCVLHQTGCRPAPELIVPEHALSKRKIDRWRMTFVARTSGSPYLTRGLVAVTHHGSEIEGFALVEVWLPNARRPLADTILASFRT